jgi:hypothetical protein
VLRAGSLRCGEGSRVTALAGSQAGALAILASSSGYSVQRFAPSGEPVGGQFSLSARPFCSGDRCDFISTAAMDDRGRFAVVWEVATGGFYSLYFQVFTPRGRPLTPRILVHPRPTHDPVSPAIALANDGTVAVAWNREKAGFLDESALVVRRFQLP